MSLALAASDGGGSGVHQMRFSSNGVTWSGWESYAASKGWALAAGDGTKTVYVQFKDNLDNVSTSYSDAIVLDTAPPSSSASSAASTASLSFSVSWSGGDGAGSGVDSYDVQYRVGSGGTRATRRAGTGESGGSWVTWLAETAETAAVFGPTSPVTVEDEETYYFRVRARDSAGNLEAYPGGDGDSSTYVEQYKVYLPLVTKAL